MQDTGHTSGTDEEATGAGSAAFWAVDSSSFPSKAVSKDILPTALPGTPHPWVFPALLPEQGSRSWLRAGTALGAG